METHQRRSCRSFWTYWVWFTHGLEDRGYEIPQDVTAIIREQDLDTGKIKEHVYKYRHAAKKKCRKLLYEGNKEITVVQQDSIHFINPKEHDVFD